MKIKPFIFEAIIFLMLLGLTACDKESSETKQQLIGIWQWEATFGGVVGETNPISEEKIEITFTDNHVLITHNLEFVDGNPVITDDGKVIQDGTYFISKEQDKLYITIVPKNVNADLLFLAGKNEFSLNQSADELTFYISVGDAEFIHVYKKVK